MAALIGTSGWHYRHWKNLFFPAGLRAADWLGYYSNRFATVELNNAFYRLPDGDAFESWAAQVPDDFTFAVKASRYLTHIKRLHDPDEPVGRLVTVARHLGPKLGPILVQLPPNLRADPDSLAAALKAFPRHLRVAVESRHPSWHDDRIKAVLEDHGAAWVWVDPAGKDRPCWRTADWGYVRFHRGRASPESCYGRTALETWAKRLADAWPADRDVYCYFNNDGHGCAPRDARRFAAAAARAGSHPSRVPGSRETPVSRPG